MSPILHSNSVLKQEEFYYLTGLQYWSLITAYGLAAADGINLTQEHIEAVYWLRKNYDQFGCCDVEFFINMLEADFELAEARSYLRALFQGNSPGNAIATWLHIAGLPVPPEEPLLTC